MGRNLTQQRLRDEVERNRPVTTGTVSITGDEIVMRLWRAHQFQPSITSSAVNTPNGATPLFSYAT